MWFRFMGRNDGRVSDLHRCVFDIEVGEWAQIPVRLNVTPERFRRAETTRRTQTPLDRATGAHARGYFGFLPLFQVTIIKGIPASTMPVPSISNGLPQQNFTFRPIPEIGKIADSRKSFVMPMRCLLQEESLSLLFD